MDAFELSYEWSPRPEPRPFDENDYVDATPIFLALRRFLAAHEGRFTIRLGENDILLDLDPDLSTIFEEISSVLQGVSNGPDGSTTELHFFEQGSDLQFLVQVSGGTLSIRLRKGVGSGQRFRMLPEGPYVVSRRDFIEGWSRFMSDVLQMLLAVSPEIGDDRSFIEQHLLVSTLLLAQAPNGTHAAQRSDGADHEG